MLPSKMLPSGQPGQIRLFDHFNWPGSSNYDVITNDVITMTSFLVHLLGIWPSLGSFLMDIIEFQCEKVYSMAYYQFHDKLTFVTCHMFDGILHNISSVHFMYTMNVQKYKTMNGELAKCVKGILWCSLVYSSF